MVVMMKGWLSYYLAAPLKVFVQWSIVFTMVTSGFAGSAEKNDHFGYTLAAGDFNNDAIDGSLLIVPYEDLGSGEIIMTILSCSEAQASGPSRNSIREIHQTNQRSNCMAPLKKDDKV
ncbi:hypothetical protein OK016_17165 [Vibrio chagasii]|nr:hypothetical protein [Vibrio chagasii]